MPSLGSERLKSIKEKLAKGVKLLAVSKTHSVDDIRELHQFGQIDFGENKLQELIEKSEALVDTNISWHFIGHLQSNKVQQLLQVKSLKSIHSIDSLKLLTKILAKKRVENLGVFLQINTSLEIEKSGFKTLEELRKAVCLLKDQQGYFLQGLMTIGKVRTDDFEKDACLCFEKMKNYKSLLDKEFGLSLELSMGMSRDFELAQKYGTDWVRIGSLLF